MTLMYAGLGLSRGLSDLIEAFPVVNDKESANESVEKV